MSDDQTQTQPQSTPISQQEQQTLLQTDAGSPVVPQQGDEKRQERDVSHASTTPLAQQPTTAGPTSTSIFQRLAAHERDLTTSGVPLSRYEPSRRAEYLALLKEKEEYDEAVRVHSKALEDEPGFQGQDSKAWADMVNANGLEGTEAVIGFAAASANMHKKMLGQVADYKRKWEESEKRAASVATQQQQQSPKITTNDGAVSSFVPQQQQQQQQQAPTTTTSFTASVKQETLNPLNKLALGDTTFNPNKTSNVVANNLLKQFSTVQYHLYGHSQQQQQQPQSS